MAEAESRIITLASAKERGLEYEEPAERRCEWCGSHLDPIGLIGFNGKVIWIEPRSASVTVLARSGRAPRRPRGSEGPNPRPRRSGGAGLSPASRTPRSTGARSPSTWTPSI